MDLKACRRRSFGTALPMRMLKLSIRNRVLQDTLRIKSYYDEIDSQLGIRFKQELKNAYDQIRTFPASFQKRDDSTRVGKFLTLPYCIVYAIRSEHVLIVALYHTSQNNEKVKGRL